MRADAVIGSDERAKRGRRFAELEGDLHLLAHVEAESAVLFGYRKAEQAQACHLRDHVRGYGVFPGDAVLQWNQALAHEPRDALDELLEGFLIDRHDLSPFAIASWQPIMSPPDVARRLAPADATVIFLL